jgi:hypothetical protein
MVGGPETQRNFSPFSGSGSKKLLVDTKDLRSGSGQAGISIDIRLGGIFAHVACWYLSQ